ncbi:MAG: hypothetical protein OHK0046_14800 [Anaerolineae bacterium]
MTTEMTGAYRIFISYAREDATDIALHLRNDLASAGHDPWLDLAEIAAGSSWARDIEEAIEQCDIALTLLSNGSYISDICRGEQLRALRKGKRVIPILVQPDADRPLHLEHLNYVDFSNADRYDELLGDLLHYITTGQSPPPIEPQQKKATLEETQPMPAIHPSLALSHRKRDLRAFRRYLTDLRAEPWLGERHWWTFFLFYFADVQGIAEILTNDQIRPPDKRRSDRWDRMVRLYFRPRTPDLFGCEGIRPAAQRPLSHCAIPVYLLFDLESVITISEARFSEGDVTTTKKTFKAASAFRDMPFDLIYHDSWIPKEKNDRGERGEILTARRAQVILPDTLDLEHLQHILCRSEAERETLLALLPESVQARWQAKIGVRPEYHLFNARWLYVEKAALETTSVGFIFHPCAEDDCNTVQARVELTLMNGDTEQMDLGEIDVRDALSLDLAALAAEHGYNIRLYLDDTLAYAGEFRA